MKACGNSFRKSYDTKVKENISDNVHGVKTENKIPSKEVYFVPWQPNPDQNKLCESLKQLVFETIEKAASQKYTSIAFPAIGCGEYGCSISLIAETLIDVAQEQLNKYRMKILFVIQADKTDAFEEFQHQIGLSDSAEQSSTKNKMSLNVGKATVVIERGDITKQEAITSFYYFEK